jgi:hypothetical protein
MYVFVLILILITPTDELKTVRYESPGYLSHALCHQAREAYLKDLAQRDDINGLYIEPCSMKL